MYNLVVKIEILEFNSLQENINNRVKYEHGQLTLTELDEKNMEQSLRLKAYRAADNCITNDYPNGCLEEFIITLRIGKN